MISSTTGWVKRHFTPSVVLAAVLTSSPSGARAQEGEPAAPDSATGKEAAPPDAPPPGDTTPSADTFVVERMPPSAYPELRRRGIPGGSLYLDPSFHGMPWPY